MQISDCFLFSFRTSSTSSRLRAGISPFSEVAMFFGMEKDLQFIFAPFITKKSLSAHRLIAICSARETEEML